MSKDYDPSVFIGTMFNERTARLNQAARWIGWDRFHMPEVFVGFEIEVDAIHNGVMLEDKSPLTKYSFSGPDAQRLLDHLVPRDITKIEVNHVFYTPWCDERGKLIIDNPVFRLDDDTYVNIGDPLDLWLAERSAGFDVQIDDVSDSFGILAMQGPRSRGVLEALVPDVDWKALRFARGRRATLPGGAEVYVWRLGFTGQPGYEFWVPKEAAVGVYDAIMTAGGPLGIVPCGHNAQNVARVEAGILMPGLEYTRAGPDSDIAAYVSVDEEALSSPFELNLGRFIDFNKPADFVGREALAEEQRRGSARKLVGLEIDWRTIEEMYHSHNAPAEVSRRIDWARYPVRHGTQLVGHASSVCWSPTTKKMIGFGQLKKQFATAGTQLAVEWTAEGTVGEATAIVVDLPFVPDRRRA
ncbi:MAG: aminomethyltransferase family protein [Acidimicrobiia bacterium]|nr:aminomethyltransferase family protein [Acidimicrobiia bacterium]